MTLAPSIHPAAIVEKGAKVGAGTRVWAFVHILPGARIGTDCNICDHCFVEGDVQVGDRVTVKSGIYLWDGVRIGDDVFLGPNVVFTNDRYPRSRRQPGTFPETRIESGASIGANATLLPGVRIGSYAMVGAGSVVTKDVPAHAAMAGNPARRKGWACVCGEPLRMRRGTASHCGRTYAWTRRGGFQVRP
ncbi:MAG TPA: acyltransferase [Candidatus Thermoplasmatota archaeon]|nr:acyltransferase [Candidatus Thermoplasmatota archaeon]